MTPEEYEAKIAQLEADNQALAQEKNQLEINQKNQNAYITKLESDVKKPASKTTTPNLQDKRLTAYLEKNMKKDAIEEATSIIKQNVSVEVYNCLEKELNNWLDKYMTIDKANADFIIDSFNLIYGQAMTNKEHPIHKIGQAPENKPAAEPVTQPQVVQQNTANQQRVVTNVSDQLRNFMGVPNMTPNDTNAVQTPPVNNPHPINNTKDAMSAFKERIRNQGANRFS